MTGWLSGWSYCEEQIIDGSSGAGTNYQVRVVVHYGSGTSSGEHIYLNSLCKADFGDLRFTDDSSNLLDYWVQSQVDGDYAVVWVEVSANLDNDQTIYLYYGKPSATTLSNGVNTFLFFDDFDGSTLDTNKWIVQYWANSQYGHGVASYSIANSKITMRDAGVNSYRTIELWSKTFNVGSCGMIIKADFDYLEVYNVCYSYGLVNRKSTTYNDRQYGKIGRNQNNSGLVWAENDYNQQLFETKMIGGSQQNYNSTMRLNGYIYFSKYIAGTSVSYGATNDSSMNYEGVLTYEIPDENMFISLLSGTIDGSAAYPNVMHIDYVAIRKVIDLEPEHEATIYRGVNLNTVITFNGVNYTIAGIMGAEIDLAYSGGADSCYSTRVKAVSAGSRKVFFIITRLFCSDTPNMDLFVNLFKRRELFDMGTNLLDKDGVLISNTYVILKNCKIYGWKQITGGANDTIGEQIKGYATDWDITDFAPTT